MRWVIVGAGAVGGTLGARLHQAGQEVLLVARGAHHDAIVARGLTLQTPSGSAVLAVPVVPVAGGLPRSGIGEADIVVLATKSQDSGPALEALAAAAPAATPVLCAQNGVDNERTALRMFRHVYGGLVLAAVDHLQPGVVQSYGTDECGIIDLGCYPDGVDDRAEELARVIGSAGWRSQARPDIMRHKYAKLIANLSNVLEVICGPVPGPASPGPTSPGPGRALLAKVLRQEGRAVLDASGISHGMDPREPLETGEIGGGARPGGSTWQSMARGAPSLETDYLNGEIVLLGRLCGVPTPANELVTALARQAVNERLSPGWLPAEQLLARL